MKRLISLALITLPLAACVTAPTVSLPALDADFPKAWDLRGEDRCMPKAGVTLETAVYTQNANDGMLKIVIITKKDGVRILQTKVLLDGKMPLGAMTEILDHGKVISIHATEKDALEKMKQVLTRALDLTESEYASCH